ncbi:MAG: LytR C-terminal domain-containing protein, partial [Solirubrobacteraceae bacterium]
GSESRSPRRVLPFLVVVVLVAAIAVAAVLVFGHHHTKAKNAASTNRTHSGTTAGKATSGRKGKHAVTVNPRQVTVAVLNGTTTNNLAAGVSRQLGKLGFKQGKATNFSNQSQTTTTVGFLPGHRAQALAVAKALKVKYSKVLRVNATTQQIVCPAGASCPDQVFVVLGTDLNSQA